MSRRLAICVFMAFSGLTMLKAQPFEGKGLFRLVSAYQDDPSVEPSIVKWIGAGDTGYLPDGRRVLRGPRVRIIDEEKIYSQDKETREFKPVAWNPWPEPVANAEGEFVFADEERFPILNLERGPDGAVLRRDGLQVWSRQDLRLGMNTAFAAAVATKTAAEDWAGRAISWGQDGVLEINAHTFIDFQAFYSPSARMLFFGVVPYRKPGQTETRIFETATSWEMVAHESGHAVGHTLKPNMNRADIEYRAWSESFSDQTAMWTSLRDKVRARRLLAGTNGDLNSSNALTRVSEMFGYLVPGSTSLRDAFNEKKVSETEEEEHDRSEVFTGAAYNIFLEIYNTLKSEAGMEEALPRAGQIMGVFLMRAMDFMPENQVTLDDVGKAYLKVDKEFFQGRYHTKLVNEFLRRELFQPVSEPDWLAHEAALPHLNVPRQWTDGRIEEYILSHQNDLGIGPEFGLKLQSVIRTNDSGVPPAFEQTIVRVQLTEGRGEGSNPLENHGILVFRADGTLADYHSPLPGDSMQLAAEYFAQAQAASEIDKARQHRMSQLGVPLALRRQRNGRISVEARVLRGEGLNAYMEVFTLGNPRGERHEIMIPPLRSDKRFRIAEELLR